jgi:hypothetical protein
VSGLEAIDGERLMLFHKRLEQERETADLQEELQAKQEQEAKVSTSQYL